MIKKIENFFFGQVFGRVVARLAVSGAAYIVSQAAGAGININPDELSAALITGANALYTWLKDWREKRAAAAIPAAVVPVVPS